MTSALRIQLMLLYTDATGANGSVTFDLVETERWEGGAVPTKYPVERGPDVTDNVRPQPDKVSLTVFATNEPIAANMWTEMVTIPTVIGIDSPDVDLPTAIIEWQEYQNNLALRALGAAAAGLVGGLAGPLGSAIGSIAGGAILGQLLPPVKVPHVLDVSPNSKPAPPNLPVTARIQQPATSADYVRKLVALLDQLKDAAQLFTVVGTKKTVDNMVITKIGQLRDAGTGTGAEFDLQLEEIRMVDTTTVPAPAPTMPRAQAPVNAGAQSTQPATPKQSILFDAVN